MLRLELIHSDLCSVRVLSVWVSLVMFCNIFYDLPSIPSTLNVRNFCTKMRFGSFYHGHVTRKDAETMFVRKIRTYNVDEIDTKLGWVSQD